MNSISRPSVMITYPKAAAILLALLVPLVPSLTPAQDVSPGWQIADDTLRDGHSGLVMQGIPVQWPQPAPPPNQPSPPAPPEPSIADEITPEIAALAQGLRGDPLMIHRFCHERIRHECYWGSKKGAAMTLLEGSGNCFDTASLMVALLRASGVEDVEYRYGLRLLDPDWARAWLGLLHPSANDGVPFPHLNDTQFASRFGYTPGTTITAEMRYNQLVTTYLYKSGYPFVGYLLPEQIPDEGFFFGPVFAVPHVWVRFRDPGGLMREFDPSFKLPKTWMFEVLRPAAGDLDYVRDTFLGQSGGSVSGDGTAVSDSMAAGINGQLSHHTGKMIDWLHGGTRHGASADELLYTGSPEPLPKVITYDGQELWPGWDYSEAITMPIGATSWTSIPALWESGVTFAFGNGYVPASDSFTSPLATITKPTNWLRGRKLSLVLTAGNATFRADEEVLLSFSIPSGGVQLKIAVNHPSFLYDDWGTLSEDGYLDQNEVKTYIPNSSHAIIYGFDPSAAHLRLSQRRLDAYRAAGSNGDWREVTETLNVMGLSYLQQVSSANGIVATMGKAIPLHHHIFGRASQEGAYYIDVGLSLSGTRSYAWSEPSTINVFHASSHFASALEHGIIEQMQGPAVNALSTARMAALANQQGADLHLVGSTNWAAKKTILTATGTWQPSDLNAIEALLTDPANTGAKMLIPSRGNVAMTSPPPAGQWRGAGYSLLSDTKSGMFISGNYSGGYVSSDNTTVSTAVLLDYIRSAADYQQAASGLVQSAHQPVTTPAWTAADPVDMATGAFLSEHTDLVCGSGSLPRGLSFHRSYHSNRSADDSAGLGYGWNHNLDIRAIRRSPTRAAWGETTPAQMAATYTAAYIAYDVFLNRANARDYAATALIADWAVNRLRDGGVAIQSGGVTLEFVQMPNGSFVSPAGITSTLTQGTGGALTLTERHGNTWLFNTNGFLATVTDPHGNAAVFAYTTHTSGGQTKTVLDTVTDCHNRLLTLGWLDGRLDTVTETAGGLTRGISFGYTGGCLTNVTDPEASVTTYRYDSTCRLDQIKDGRDRIVTENIYDSEGRVTTQKLHGLAANTFELFFNGITNTELNPALGETSYHYDTRGRGTGITDATGNRSFIAYDGQDRQIATANPSNNGNTSSTYRPTTTTYNAAHNPVATILPKRDVTDTTTDTQRTITRDYDSQQRLWKQYDLKGACTETTYTAQHQVYQIKDRKGQLILTNAYNTDGTLLSTTDAANQTTEYLDYDSYGHPQTIKYPAVTFNGTSVRPTETFLYNARGDLLEHTDRNGNLTSTTYNDRRQPRGTTHPAVDGITAATEITYDAAGNPNAARDARGNWTYTDTSQTGKTLTIKLPPTPAGNPVITSHYNNRDWLDWTKDPVGNTTSFLHDAAGRVTETTDPLFRVTKSAYNADGQPYESRDGRDKPTTVFYNWRGEIWKTTDPLSHAAITVPDANGNPDTYTNKRNKTYDYTFDANDRQTSLKTPLFNDTQQDYYSTGLLQYISEPSTDRAEFTYDNLGRPEITTFKQSGATVATHTRTYDKQGNPKSLTEVAGGVTTTLAWNEHDARNRVRTYTDARSQSIGYRYDAANNLTELIYPGGIGSVHYTYDTHNRLETVTDWSNRVTRYHYDISGRVTRIEHANGTARRHAWDAAGQSRGISELNKSGQPIHYSIHRFDDAGRQDQTITSPTLHAYTLPAFAATYDDDNRILILNGQSVTVDADGNLYGSAGIPPAFSGLTYNSRNQLLTAGSLSYKYDPLGQRIGVTDTTGETKWTIDPTASRALVREKPDGTKTYYIYGAGLLYEINGTATTTYHYDHRGNTVALTADNGTTVLDRIEYSPYGMETWRLGTYDTPFRFCGAFGVQTDSNGLLNMRARYYSPHLMRFLNADPIGFSGGPNWFAYADGNPISRMDPFGLWSWNSIMGVVKAVGGAAEVVAGAGLAAATGWTGVGAVGGGIVALHGLDTLQSGLRQAFSGDQVDTMTSNGLQAAGMSRNAANLVDTGISIGFSLGASSASGAIRSANGLAHLTNAGNAARIASSGELIGANYAGPASNALRSGWGVTAATGMNPGVYSAIRIPEAAQAAFAPVRGIGPFSTWQATMGQAFTANGNLSLASGAFYRFGMNTGQATIYGLDAAWTGVRFLGSNK